MKICPRCQKTYSDENLNFCLDDGAVLTPSNAVDNSIPATVLMNQTRPTAASPPFANQGGTPGNWNAPPPQFSMPATTPQKSKTWLWVLGILGGLMLICGGGFVGFVFWAASLDNNNSNRAVLVNTSNYNSGSSIKNKSVANSISEPINNSSVQKIDLSKWVNGNTDLGDTEFTDGELLMSSGRKNYYYVLAAQAVYKTAGAATKVTVRNVNQESSNLGSGLVIHSNPIPLTQDYAFLIDSESKKYRVVRHTPGDEIVVVKWTRSTAVKNGTQGNVLEVRDAGKTMNFYINGEFIRSVGNTDGFSGGVAGLYAGDAVQTAFSDLEINQ